MSIICVIMFQIYKTFLLRTNSRFCGGAASALISADCKTCVCGTNSLAKRPPLVRLRRTERAPKSPFVFGEKESGAGLPHHPVVKLETVDNLEVTGVFRKR